MLPSAVDSFEFFGFSRELLGNIRGIEYWLKIHPLSLAFAPFFKNITHSLENLVPLHNSLFEGFFERRESHGLGIDNMLVKSLLNFIVASDDMSNSFIRQKGEINSFPLFFHVFQHRFNHVLF